MSIKLYMETEKCSFIGVSRQVAVLSDKRVTGINVGLFRWMDKTCWEKQVKPVITEVIGEYPSKENEIMLPKWAANKMGIINFKPQQEIELSFYYGGTQEGMYGRLSDIMTNKFVISGFYEDNSIEYIKSNMIIYASEDFWKSAGFGEERYKTAAYITLENNINFSDLYNVFSPSEGQDLSNLRYQGENSVGGILGILAAVLVIMVCGGLIIYNVLYISVSQDIHFLGQLKTLGMTKHQLRAYLYYQICWLCLIGISSGLTLAMLMSKLVIPIGIKAISANKHQDVLVSFSPVILVSAIVFSVLSVLLGSLKSLNVVGNATAIAAMRYTNVGGKRKERKKRQDSIISIALRNIFRNRKNVVVVFLSLFLGITIYLIIDGLFSGVSVSALVGQYMKYDFEIKEEYSQGLITEEAIKKLKDIEGVKQVDIQRVVMDDNNKGCWINVDENLNEYCSKRLEAFPQMKPQLDIFKQGNMYKTEIIGIGEAEFKRLSQKYNLDVDYDEFKAGDIGIWCCDEGLMDEKMNKGVLNVYPNGLNGEGVNIKKMASKVVPVNDTLLGCYIAPNILMNNEALCDIAKTCIKKVDILIESTIYDQEVRQAIEYILGDSSKITIDSKQEKQDELGESFLMLSVLGIALSLILFVIGIMNFVNTIYASILTRKKELAVLECIGMSKVQVKNMLITEGMFYMVITCALVFTIGTAIYWVAVEIFSTISGYTEFSYPFRTAVVMIPIMLVMAIVTPLFSYRGISEKSAVEQLRKVE